MPVAPGGLGLAVLVQLEHLGLLALFAELVRRIDREQHGFPLALVGPVLFTVEFDEPHVFLPHDEVARAPAFRNEGCSLRGMAEMGPSHGFPPAVGVRLDTTPSRIEWFRLLRL